MPTIHSLLNRRTLSWPAALYIAFIFLWYEQYKLTGNQGSVDLFTTITDWLYLDGYEKPFRLTVATAEIIASVLVVIPLTRMYGAVLSFGIISGAIFFHVASPLGIDPYQDGATLFKEALAVWACSVFIMVCYRDALIAIARAGMGHPPIQATT